MIVLPSTDKPVFLQYHMMDFTRNLRFKIQATQNDTYIAVIEQNPRDYDNIGARYYVIAVVLIYGLSIVMMIASHIRRNKQDGQLRSYLKEMAALRKKNRREQLLEKMTSLAEKSGLNVPNQQKCEETSFNENRRPKPQDSSLYARLPSEPDDESRETLLGKNRLNSTSDNDSVFLFSVDTPKNESPPKTPKIALTPKLTPKQSRIDRCFFQVINENAPL